MIDYAATSGKNVDLYMSLLNVSKEDLDKREDVHPQIKQRVLRVRDLYAHWLAYPNLRESKLAEKCMKDYDVTRAVAYADIHLLKIMMGDLGKATKDFARWRFDRMVLDAYEKAEKKEDIRSMVAAAAAYAKYHRLDMEDAHDRGYDKIIPQPFYPTSDPRSLGIKRIPNIHARIKKLLKKYSDVNMELIEAEREDYDLDQMAAALPADYEEVEEDD